MGYEKEEGCGAYIMKRAFDFAASLVGLLLLMPMLAAIGFVIWLEDGGPVFYRGVRVGRYGKPFRILKLRSMVVNAERLGGSCTADNDSRVTGVGRFLRKYKLDELPQLINVLLGEMSLVGPRPEVEQYVNLFIIQTPGAIVCRARPQAREWIDRNALDDCQYSNL